MALEVDPDLRLVLALDLLDPALLRLDRVLSTVGEALGLARLLRQLEAPSVGPLLVILSRSELNAQLGVLLTIAGLRALARHCGRRGRRKLPVGELRRVLVDLLLVFLFALSDFPVHLPALEVRRGRREVLLRVCAPGAIQGPARR